jgi:hypothetical protein
LPFFHFQFSIFHFQLLNNEAMRLSGRVCLLATEVALSGKSGGNEVLYCAKTTNHNHHLNHINHSSDRISAKARKHECRGEKFFALDRNHAVAFPFIFNFQFSIV